MPQKSETDATDSSRTTAPKGQAPNAESAASGPAPSVRVRGRRIDKQDRKQYLVATRRAPGLSAMGLSPLSLGVVEQALRATPDIEVVDVISPRSTVGASADGLSGSPNVIVARMSESKAQLLHQQGQGQLIVEPDQPLTLVDALPGPSMVTASVSTAPPLVLQVLVVAPDETPIEGAEVYVYGNLLPTLAITNKTGNATLSVFGETPQSIRALYVKARSDYWSFYQTQPSLDPTQLNVVVLRPLVETYTNFPQQQVMGWGQKAMRLDQVPSDRRGQGVKIAIIDSGAANTHEDLRSIARGFDALEKTRSVSNWMVDTISHGSHCAGVIAGSSENKVGILGFAPSAEIHACKIFPGGQISHLIDALEYCVEQRVDLVNLSLGTDQVSELLEQQIQRVTSLGIACIVAAGNSGGPVQYPASSPNVMAVAAIGRLGEFPPDSYHAHTLQGTTSDGFFSPRFTCFGPEVAVCAPGVAVLSCVPPNNFAVWDGTSMAAPHVTGLAALVFAHHPDFAGPFRARNAQRVQRLFSILKASARPVDLGDPRRTGYGLPDAPAALGLQLDTQPLATQGTSPLPWFAPLTIAPPGSILAQPARENLHISSGWTMPGYPPTNPMAVVPQIGMPPPLQRSPYWGWWNGMR